MVDFFRYRNSVALFALVIGAWGMGGSVVFVRLADVDAFASGFWRLFLALPVLFVWAVFELRKIKITDFYFSRPVIYSGIFFAGDLFFWHLAILNTNIANAALLACLSPVWVAIVSPFFISERINKHTFFGLMFCLLGAFLLIGNENFLPFATQHWRGDLYAIFTGMFFALYFLHIVKARQHETTGIIAFKSTFISMLILFFITLIAEQSFLPHTAIGVFSLLALGIISQAGGQGLMTFSLGILPSLFSSLVIFIEVLAAVILGLIIFNETLNTIQTIGGFIILFGIIIARPRT